MCTPYDAIFSTAIWMAIVSAVLFVGFITFAVVSRKL
jgi:hypothetical protein